ncbi:MULTISPECIES: hypothetical protein [Paenibacillus]|uniref:hypothetical protein n=1 Tax=Paenibacillus TaxID=44249 RepID=UPI0015B9F92A|nr:MULTISPECIES: hypothetical protein [Paenibacillus]MDH6430259.1 hypothetical protein [Paenibacillus sp. PastH-4]MDH6446474.1 hypothetical protein [Paenibacillus sp. PastF-4]MDH6530060.1 hypothetical protein [Paenibacillus sp. PastH-3]
MDEFHKTSSKFYGLFVIEFPEYTPLFMAWTNASQESDTKLANKYAKKLFHLMRVNGWG